MTPVRTKEEAMYIIRELMSMHCILEKGWAYELTHRNYKRNSVACCNYLRRKLSFVEFFALHLTFEDFKEVIIHEIVHVLLPHHGHDKYFRALCLKLGGTPNRQSDYSYLKDALPNHLKKKINYVYVCPVCGHKMETTRKLKRQYSCGKCSPRFDERFIMVLQEN